MSQRGSANAIVPGLTSSPPEVRALDPNAPPPSQPDGDASSATTHTFKDLAEVNRLHDQAVESNLQLLERVLRDPTKMYSYGIHENVGKAEHPPLSPMESCVFKSGLSFLMGGALGGFLGLFMGSHSTVSFDPAVEKLSGREQMRYQLKQMRKATFSSAKNFAVFGMVYSGVECMIEKVRDVMCFDLCIVYMLWYF